MTLAVVTGAPGWLGHRARRGARQGRLVSVDPNIAGARPLRRPAGRADRRGRAARRRGRPRRSPRRARARARVRRRDHRLPRRRHHPPAARPRALRHQHGRHAQRPRKRDPRQGDALSPGQLELAGGPQRVGRPAHGRGRSAAPLFELRALQAPGRVARQRRLPRRPDRDARSSGRAGFTARINRRGSRSSSG